jgi:(1->4)-alpha-D-glucan 1-alpha-D-glucosylmutase
LVIIPRLYARLLDERDQLLPLGERVWGDTAVEIPSRCAAARWRNTLDGRVVAVELRDGRHSLSLSQVLANFPVALLEGLS